MSIPAEYRDLVGLLPARRQNNVHRRRARHSRPGLDRIFAGCLCSGNLRSGNRAGTSLSLSPRPIKCTRAFVTPSNQTNETKEEARQLGWEFD